MSSARLNAIFLSVYFEYNKPIFMAIWLVCFSTLWFFIAPQEAFLMVAGESFVYAFFITLVAFVIVIPVIFAVLITGFAAVEAFRAIAAKQEAQK